jgi:hypothetical protein
MGFPRSGTSGLASGISQLQGFSDYNTEGHFLYLFANAIDRIREDHVNPNCVVRDAESKAAFFQSIADGADAAYRVMTGAERYQWIDKTPDIQQVEAIPAILSLFPDSWFLYIYRDPVSAVRSNLATWPDQLAGKHVEVANRWVACQRQWRAKRSAIAPEKRLEIYQSELLATPQKVTRALARKMNLSEEEIANALEFWSKNKRVNRPTEGDAAQVYDARQLDDSVAQQVMEICAAEVAHWPKLNKND